MDQDKPPAPEKPDRKAEPALSAKKLAQKQRLAEALRANLRRRKAQVRQRKADPGGETGS
jgi:hypothetical protein